MPVSFSARGSIDHEYVVVRVALSCGWSSNFLSLYCGRYLVQLSLLAMHTLFDFVEFPSPFLFQYGFRWFVLMNLTGVSSSGRFLVVLSPVWSVVVAPVPCVVRAFNV